MNFSAKKLALSAVLLCLLAAGTAVTASAAAPVQGLAITLPTVRWPWEAAVESIETGEYSSSIEVGETQQLVPVISPEKAANAAVSYVSDNEAVLAVASDGTIQGVSLGTAQVTATAGGKSCTYTITVVPNASMIVAEMDLSLSANRIAVGDTASVSIQVLPTTSASYAEIALSSSNEKVATVNNFGKVTGIAPGTATITAACGSVSASAKITVVSASSSTPTSEHLTLNTTYVVLKPGETRALQVSVSPSNASKNFTFKSGDTSVATVSAGGVISAVGTGATAVVVSNGTATASVTVIVNRTAASSSITTDSEQNNSAAQDSDDPVVRAIQKSAKDEIVFEQSEVPIVTSEMLDALRVSGKTLCLTSQDCNLRVRGKDVRNTTNAFHTAVSFTPVDKGVELTLDDGTALPGSIEIELTGGAASYKKLYLYNEVTGKWQYLNSYADSVVTIDSAGRYLLTNETISLVRVNWFFLAAAGVVVIILGIFYVVFKKRYWFW